jgi:hypothetical protein
VPPLFAGEAPVADDPSIFVKPGIIIDVFADYTASVRVAANTVVGWRWKCKVV